MQDMMHKLKKNKDFKEDTMPHKIKQLWITRLFKKERRNLIVQIEDDFFAVYEGKIPQHQKFTSNETKTKVYSRIGIL
jgi:hypothetical protein